MRDGDGRVPEIDERITAAWLVGEHGDDALAVAHRRADDFRAAGQLGCLVVWRRIADATAALLAEKEAAARNEKNHAAGCDPAHISHQRERAI
ncbi:MAG TPA: hypothetical protein VGD08_10100 [Stellaceae bacterium]|jgi:hypothetical protein